MQRRASQSTSIQPPPQSQPPLRFWTSAPLVLSLAGAGLLWASFPPLNLWPLAWVAPLPWLWLILLPEWKGKRPWLAIWLGGFVHWLVMLQGIRLAHEALYGGWIALAWYLAFYLPAFIGLTRVAVQRLKIPVVIAAPVVWVGLELIRGHLLSGFSLCLLSHTQAGWPLVLQISDLGGAYAVSFVMMLVAACVARVAPIEVAGQTRLPRTLNPALVAGAVLSATLGYGAFRLRETPPDASRHPVHIALIQGSLDTVFGAGPEQIDKTYRHYGQLTSEARQAHERLDAVIWPESMFIIPERVVQEPLAATIHEQLSLDELRAQVAAAQSQFEAILAGEINRANTAADGRRFNTPTRLIIGTTTYVYGPGEQLRTFNSALLAEPGGAVANRYYKMHPVMFGEYIPFADAIPWLYTITPMTGGLSVGERPAVFDVAGLKMSPSICFESVVPHLIRRQVTQLQREGTPADALVNVSNDGWFWGTAILEHHFRCSIFRAIENRKPLVIAANTGISASIDGSGRVLAKGPRREPAVLLAEVRKDGRNSPYHTVGDAPAWLCALACLGLAIVGWRSRGNNSPPTPRRE